jgi:anti-sigma B factor antagonist
MALWPSRHCAELALLTYATAGVDFIASMGIRMFITAARSMALRHAKLALYGAQSMVNEVFEHVSMTDFIPVVENEAEAIAAVSS